MAEYLYQPYYCEENIWQLCQHPAVRALPCQVVFISNAPRVCPVWQMRAGRDGEPVFWDYHVILLVWAETWQVWDLDSTLGMPIALGAYLAGSFRVAQGRYAPRFRVVPAPLFLSAFRSDRSHMREGEAWLAPPPPWPPSGSAGTSNLAHFIDLEQPFLGEVCALEGLLACLERQRTSIEAYLPKQRTDPDASPTTSLPSASAGEAISADPVS